jgi:hypothetical protein
MTNLDLFENSLLALKEVNAPSLNLTEEIMDSLPTNNHGFEWFMTWRTTLPPIAISLAVVAMLLLSYPTLPERIEDGLHIVKNYKISTLAKAIRKTAHRTTTTKLVTAPAKVAITIPAKQELPQSSEIPKGMSAITVSFPKHTLPQSKDVQLTLQRGSEKEHLITNNAKIFSIRNDLSNTAETPVTLLVSRQDANKIQLALGLKEYQLSIKKL